jgi:hypothetical protein
MLELLGKQITKIKSSYKAIIQHDIVIQMTYYKPKIYSSYLW